MKKLLLLLLVFLTNSLCIYSQFGSLNDISKSAFFPFDAKPFDLDNDGDIDILCAIPNADKIAWYENLGGGAFGHQQIISLNAFFVKSINAADLDGDGDMDVISASQNDDKIAWYENLGGGAFGIQKIITISADGASCVIAADLDNDSYVDVLSASTLDNKIAWYKNLGGGVFGTQQILSINTLGATCVFVKDIDGDGNNDVLSASKNDNKIAWFKNLGGGIFDTQQIITTNAISAESVYSADIDGDGDMDVLSASNNDFKIAWYENLGGGTFGVQNILYTNSDPKSVYAIDIDNDGDIDVLSANGNAKTLALSENLGGGIFGTTQILSVNINSPFSIAAADFNSDGHLDILSAAGNVIWHENLGGLAFGPENIISENLYVLKDIKLSDLDGDGDTDVLSASQNDDKIAWYENLGSGKFNTQQHINIPDVDDNYVNLTNGNADGVQSIFTMDLDGDGDVDVLSASQNDDKIAWYENLGSGSFGPQQIVSDSADGAQSIFSTDIDGDGNMDVLSASKNDHTIAWYENLGSGSFSTEKVITNNAIGARCVYAADLDNDGDMDVLSASYSDDKVAWYENLGAGTFGPQQIISVNADYVVSVHAADMDNDGDMDVLSASYSDDKIAWYENLGAGTFGPQQIISIVYRANFVNTYDLDGDGDLDVLSASHNGGNKIEWHENLGGGIFAAQRVIDNRSMFATTVHAFDMDGDGDGDVISASEVDQTIGSYENFIGSPYKLIGQIFYDKNQNKLKDTNELGLSFIPVNINPNNSYSFSSNNGNYSLDTDTGTYKIGYNFPSSSWHLTTDSATYTRTLTGSSQIIDSLNFGFHPDTNLTIINSSLTGGFPRCNTTINYWMTIQNQGTTIPNGTVHLELDDSIIFVSSSIIPDSIIGQNIYWHYDSLFFYASEMINLQVQMPSFTNLGNTLSSILTVRELDTGNNIIYSRSDTLHQRLVCAYDPNDKSVIPEGLGAQGYVLNNQELEYLIRFQNTGNDTAISVMIRDQLDNNLDWNTLIPIASSHSMQMHIEQDGEIVCKFENIMLPDSNVNEVASHGFVKFKINMKPNLVPSTTIHNTAHIYFDFNPAVITNTVVNTIYDCNTLPINIVNTIVCIGEQLIAFSPEGNINNYNWDINSFYTSLTDTLLWTADTAGIFNLKLTANNPFCSKDTIVNLEVLPSTPIINNNQSICQNDSLLIYGSYQNTNGVYYDSLQTINGCDSILSTTLTINPVFSSNTNLNICQGDSLLIFGSYQNTNGIYYDSLQTINGCDSILSTTLTINPVFSSNTNLNICQGDSLLIFGSYQNTNGIYYDSLQTINGCDSILSTILTINLLPSVTITSFNPDTICSDANITVLPIGLPAGGSYIGMGVSNGNFDPTLANIGTNNIVYVYTDINACTNSDTTTVIIEVCTSINETINDFGILIYPNPNTGQFTIEKPKGLNKEIRVKLLDPTSKLVLDKSWSVNEQKIKIDINNYDNGLYYLHLISNDDIFIKKIVKK